MNQPQLSIVVPCYNEEKALPAFFSAMRKVLDGLHLSWEIICVNDGSQDATLNQLLRETRHDPRVIVVDLTRNFGKEAALTAGLDHANGEAVIPIDVDLQDPPELIAQMVEKWREGYDMVVARRAARDNDTLFKHKSALLFYQIYNKLAYVTIPENTGDFRLMDRRVVDALKQLPERNRFMKGMYSWLGFKQATVYYERPARCEGESKFNFWKLWNLALDGLTSFSTLPLRVWTYAGGLIAFGAFLYAVFLVFDVLMFGKDLPGYASIMVVMLFLGGVQLISLGVIGEYLGRTYTEVKQRPVYLVNRVHAAEPLSKLDPAISIKAAQ